MFFWAVARVKRPAIVSLFGCGGRLGPMTGPSEWALRVGPPTGPLPTLLLDRVPGIDLHGGPQIEAQT